MTRWLMAVLVLEACGFQGNEAPDGGGDPIDATVPDAPPDGMVAPDDIVHVAPGDERVGTGDLTVDAAITVDTTALSFGMALPDGVTFTSAAQDGAGPELAILRVRTLAGGGALRVVGSRPLVVLAEAIDFRGTLDLAGHGSQAGAGARTTGGGGPGGHNFTVSSFSDSGGGGGGGSSAGAVGGNAVCPPCTNDRVDGGTAGASFEAAALAGGAPGGASSSRAGTSCDVGAPGAGGGAIELYARTRIALSGKIHAGGGGGRGGDRCPDNWLAGHGGGGGGMIVLQAPDVEVSGKLSASGGAGGSGAGGAGSGISGEDAREAEATPIAARGGSARGQYSAAGGDGATSTSAAAPGGNALDGGNGGGGGGGLGRIVVLYRTRGTTGIASPPAMTATY